MAGYRKIYKASNAISDDTGLPDPRAGAAVFRFPCSEFDQVDVHLFLTSGTVSSVTVRLWVHPSDGRASAQGEEWLCDTGQTNLGMEKTLAVGATGAIVPFAVPPGAYGTIQLVDILGGGSLIPYVGGRQA